MNTTIFQRAFMCFHCFQLTVWRGGGLKKRISYTHVEGCPLRRIFVEEINPHQHLSQLFRFGSLPNNNLPSLKLTWPLKMDGWKTSFLLGRPIFRGYVSFRECTCFSPEMEVKNMSTTSCHKFRGYVMWDIVD